MNLSRGPRQADSQPGSPTRTPGLQVVPVVAGCRAAARPARVSPALHLYSIPQHHALRHLPEEPSPFHYPRAHVNWHDRCSRQRNQAHPTTRHRSAAANGVCPTLETSCMFGSRNLESTLCESGLFEDVNSATAGRCQRKYISARSWSLRSASWTEYSGFAEQ